MGLKTASTNNLPNTNIGYSNFLGMLYARSAEVDALVEKVKAEAGGESEVRKGFTGLSGNSKSAVARASLAEFGVKPVTVEGQVFSAKVRMVETKQGEEPYLNLGLRDDDGNYWISSPVANQGTQMLIRKLFNVTPGDIVELNMFATYGPSNNPDHAGKNYASHGCSLLRAGTQVTGVPVDGLRDEIQKILKGLADARIVDRNTINSARSGATKAFHLDLLKQISEKFDRNPVAQAAAQEAQEPTAQQASPASEEPASSFDSFEDEIPF